MKHLHIISFVILAGLLLSACGAGAEETAVSTPIPVVKADTAIVAEGRLEPIHYVDIAFNANGTVSEVLVSEGEQVTEGQVIARLENSEAKQADVAKAEEDFLVAQQAFDSAEATALGKLADAHEAVRKAQYEFDNFDIPSDLRDMGTREALSYTADKLEEARINFEPYKYLEERLEWELARENPNKPKVYRNNDQQSCRWAGTSERQTLRGLRIHRCNCPRSRRRKEWTQQRIFRVGRGIRDDFLDRPGRRDFGRTDGPAELQRCNQRFRAGHP